jgi:predicted RNase H-like HicB family nuclease
LHFTSGIVSAIIIGDMTRYKLPIEINSLEEGGYLATSPALPGFLVQAETVEEVLQLAPGVAQALIEAMREKGVPLPQALQSVEPPFHAELLVPV